MTRIMNVLSKALFSITLAVSLSGCSIMTERVEPLKTSCVEVPKEERASNIDVGSLAETIEERITCSDDEYTRTKFYVVPKDNSSDKAVIFLDDFHPSSHEGNYNPMLEILMDHVQSIGLEGIVYGIPLETQLEQSQDTTFTTCEFMKKLNESSFPTFGLEDYVITYEVSVEYTFLRDEIIKALLRTESWLREDYINLLENINNHIILKYRDKLGLGLFPLIPINPEREYDGLVGDYFDLLDEASAYYECDLRTETAVQIILKEFEANPDTNIVCIRYGSEHYDLASAMFDEMGISYILIGNRNADRIKEIHERTIEILR